jgi:hypothetical protein
MSRDAEGQGSEDSDPGDLHEDAERPLSLDDVDDDGGGDPEHDRGRRCDPG